MTSSKVMTSIFMIALLSFIFPAYAQDVFSSGRVGQFILVEVHSPREVRVNEAVNIDATFYIRENIYVRYLTLRVEAPGDRYSETIVLSKWLDKGSTIDKTVRIKPEQEGVIRFIVEAEYSRYGYADYGYLSIDVGIARALTYDMLKSDYNSLKSENERLKDRISQLETTLKQLEEKGYLLPEIVYMLIIAVLVGVVVALSAKRKSREK